MPQSVFSASKFETQGRSSWVRVSLEAIFIKSRTTKWRFVVQNASLSSLKRPYMNKILLERTISCQHDLMVRINRN